MKMVWALDDMNSFFEVFLKCVFVRSRRNHLYSHQLQSKPFRGHFLLIAIFWRYADSECMYKMAVNRIAIQ